MRVMGGSNMTPSAQSQAGNTFVVTCSIEIFLTVDNNLVAKDEWHAFMQATGE